MEKKTDVQVVMLPTENERKGSYITIDNVTGKLGYQSFNQIAWAKPQHIYFTSDEEIKEGDWYYNATSQKIFKANLTDVTLAKEGFEYAKKIVASTDPSLGLPTIPESFIQKYVAANGKIDKVRLEMIPYDGKSSISNNWNGNLKLTANNEVVEWEEPAHTVVLTKLMEKKTKAQIAAKMMQFMRNDAVTIIELCKGFTGEPTNNAMKSCLKMTNYVLELTNNAATLKWRRIDPDNLPTEEVVVRGGRGNNGVMTGKLEINDMSNNRIACTDGSYDALRLYDCTHYIPISDLLQLPKD